MGLFDFKAPSVPAAAPPSSPARKTTDANAGFLIIDKKDIGGGAGGAVSGSNPWGHLSAGEKSRRLEAVRKKSINPRAEFQYKSKSFTKMMKNRKLSDPGDLCKPDLTVNLPEGKKPLVRPGAQGNWLCTKTLDSVIKYRERQYQNQENEFRVFIEGAEVTSYVEGSLSWTTESTGGVNTARIVLNNTQDAFIITPENVCSGPYALGSWRINYQKKRGKPITVYTGAARATWRVDEVAKWQIYRRKYEAVNPEGEDKQIDAINGMWLYPLNPFSCIFNKNDAVRIFVRIPHTTVVRNVRKREWYDLWMPAFTGFIDKYSWTDAPIEGKRSVSITCYDFRGLMERMRVRVFSNPLTDSEKKKIAQQRKNKAKNSRGKSSNTSASEPSSVSDYLKPAKVLGKSFGKTLTSTFHKASLMYNQNKTQIKGLDLYTRNTDPYLYAKEGLYAESTYIDLHTLWFYKKANSVPKGATKPRCAGSSGRFNTSRGGYASEGKDYSKKCAQKALSEVDDVISQIAQDMTTSLGFILEDILSIYALTRQVFWVYPDTVTGETKSKVIVVLRLGEAKAQHARNVSGSKGSVVNLLTNARKKTEEISEEWRNQAIRYMVAGAYVQAAGSEDRGAQLAADVGWQKYYEYLKENGLNVYETNDSALTNAREALVALQSLQYLVREEPFKYDNNILYRNRREITITDPGATKKILDKAKLQLAALEKQKAALLNNPDAQKAKEYKKVTAAVVNQQKYVKSLEKIRSNPTAGNTMGPVWSERIGYKDYWPVTQITAIAADKSIFPTNAILAQSLGWGQQVRKLFDVSNKSGPIERILSQWKKSFNDPIVKAAVLSTTLRDRIERQLRLSTREPGGDYRSYVTKEPHGRGYNVGDIVRWMNWKREVMKQRAAGGASARTTGNIKKFIETLRERTIEGQARLKRDKTTADAITKFAHFETRHAGIFADLVTAVDLQPHPLMDKSYEQAVAYLCTEKLPIIPGIKRKIGSYGDKINTAQKVTKEYGGSPMDRWNRIVLFGAIGRPLTYPEVSYVGNQTTSDFSSPFSPFNVFYHMLLPAEGTGASTIIQKNTAKVTINSLNVNYETRKKLLDDISSVIDYQYWVNGWGDFIFEFPHYNAFPRDFGPITKQAYTLSTDWTSATISEESQEIPTAWVVTGRNVDKRTEKGTNKGLSKNFFKTVVMMAPILARRIGVRVENINIRIPGIGGVGDVGSRIQQAKDQIKVYGLFHIQRQLGRAHSMQVGLPFRPYIVPNRPIWLQHRQRIGLTRSVTHTMNAPMGDCSTELNLAYTRWLFRDGTFRFIAGGPRQPISYVNFFTGIPPQRGNKNITAKEGSGTKGIKKAVPLSSSSIACSGDLAIAAQTASNFSVSVSSAFGDKYSQPFNINRPSYPEGQAINGPIAGVRVTEPTNPPGDAPAIATTQAINKNDPMNFVLNVWKFNLGEKYRPPKSYGVSDGFGYLRYWNLQHLTDKFQTYKIYKKKRRSEKDYFHGGWDLNAAVGTKLKTPIDVTKARARLKTGYWVGEQNRLAWVRIGGGINRRSTLSYFSATSKNNPRVVSGYMLVYAKQYAIYKTLNDSSVKLERGWNSGGLMLDIEGEVTLKNKGAGGKIQAKLSYVHLDDIATFGPKKVKMGTKDYRQAKPNNFLAKADQVICYSGATGGSAHLHLNMWIKNSYGPNDAGKEAVQKALAANKEFIDTQLRARAGMFRRYDGTDPRDKLPALTDKANKFWQAGFRRRELNRKIRAANRRNRKNKTGIPPIKEIKPGKVTVADVMAYYQKRKTYREFVPETMNVADGKWYLVHPGFFFTVPQIIGKQVGRSSYNSYKGLVNRLIAPYNKYVTQYTAFCKNNFGKSTARDYTTPARLECNAIAKRAMSRGVSRQLATYNYNKCVLPAVKLEKRFNIGLNMLASRKLSDRIKGEQIVSKYNVVRRKLRNLDKRLVKANASQ